MKIFKYLSSLIIIFLFFQANVFAVHHFHPFSANSWLSKWPIGFIVIFLIIIFIIYSIVKNSKEEKTDVPTKKETPRTSQGTVPWLVLTGELKAVADKS